MALLASSSTFMKNVEIGFFPERVTFLVQCSPSDFLKTLSGQSLQEQSAGRLACGVRDTLIEGRSVRERGGANSMCCTPYPRD